MKKITWFHLNGCPYCAKGEKAFEELKKEKPEYGRIEIDYIEENEHPEISLAYDYQANPCLFIGKDKRYEAHFGQSYEEIKENIRRVLEEALNG